MSKAKSFVPKCDPFKLPEADVVTRSVPHTHFLTVASDALFQDRERSLAAGEPWPEELREAHAAIRRCLEAREGER